MARVRLADVHVTHELFTPRDYNLKRHLVDVTRRRTRTRQVIQALSGVSLEIEEGARLGIVGANGAGKSTLLSVVSGMLPPTRGRVDVEGRVLALLGGASAGLDQEATGRDNILTMGLQLGETPAAMRARIDDVTEFSGLSSRIDHAVHTYSSGMQARLRFSVLTSLRPDILVIDEGISTADAEFAERASGRLAEFLSSAGILVMASHSEALITQHCRSAVWLDQGVLRASGDVDDVLARYRSMYHHELEPASEPEPQPKPEPQPERESVTVELDDLPVTEAQTQPGGEISPEWTEQIDDPVAVLFEAFKRRVADMPSPKFLELGVTSQSAVDHRGWLPADCRYVGVDIAEHPDVDVVVDPHVMSEALPARYFDAAVSLISFSDLAMPWVVAVELNRVLRPGAYVYVAARHTWPLTEAGGFFRFTEHSWASLFNPFSGFEICGVASGEPARVVADVTSAVTVGLENYPAFLTSAVLARKIGETELRWDVPAADVLSARGRPNSER